MSAECTLENSDLATNNNNPSFCLLTQNWWPQDNNIHHPISSWNTTRSSNYLRQQQQANHNQHSSDSSSCEEDVQNTATNNLQQYQFLLGADDNSTSFISGETAASSDHNHLIWSQHLLSSSARETAGNINTKNLLENNNQDAISEMSLLDGASTFISSKSRFDHNQLANDDDDYFHPYSNLLLGRQIHINYTDNINAMEPSSHQYWRQGENGYQEVKLPRHHCGILPQVDNSCADDINSRSFPDFNISFDTYLSKPLVDTFNDFKPSLKTLNLAQHKKQGLQPSLTKSRGTKSTSSTLTRNGRAQEIQSEGKKRRSEDNLDTNSKRQKIESSAASSPTVQVPKVRLAEKITALQQIVSPFGKTDTASVLWETINYVRFLQEQIQLLSHAYMKSNTCKERWGGFDRKDVDLRSRGLCLVPISCTPQIYRESHNGSDYLIPSYRGCLYR